jgi:hypothetical protein
LLYVGEGRAYKPLLLYIVHSTWPPLLPHEAHPWASPFQNLSSFSPWRAVMILQCSCVAVTNYPSPPPTHSNKMKDTDCLRKIQDSRPCFFLVSELFVERSCHFVFQPSYFCLQFLGCMVM